MLFSHHSHSGQFCDHGADMLEEVVQAAISHGMHVFALTEHTPRDHTEDLYPGEKRTTADLFEIFDAYYAEAMRLKAKYAGQITLLVGFEMDWIRPSSRDLVQGLLAKHKFELFVGSVHHVRATPIDFSRELYEEARRVAGAGSDEALFEVYFDDQFEMLTNLSPPIVGHFDLIRLMSDDRNRSFSDLKVVWEKITRNLDVVARYGGLLELNSAGLRKGLDEPYPTREICKAFLGMGGRFTMSDDSHSVSQVAANYSGVLDFAEDVGIKQMYYYDAEGGFPNIAVRSVDVGLIRASMPA
ncbi:MAG: histidinolphosphatase [Thelocarpon impressellum]|nr:MAG: histidinolphosphatase [Thelocarpon impressellum]